MGQQTLDLYTEFVYWEMHRVEAPKRKLPSDQGDGNREYLHGLKLDEFFEIP